MRRALALLGAEGVQQSILLLRRVLLVHKAERHHGCVGYRLSPQQAGGPGGGAAYPGRGSPDPDPSQPRIMLTFPGAVSIEFVFFSIALALRRGSRGLTWPGSWVGSISSRPVAAGRPTHYSRPLAWRFLSFSGSPSPEVRRSWMLCPMFRHF